MYGTFGGTGTVDGFAAKGTDLAENTAPIGGARRGVVGAETNTLRGQIVDGKAATTNIELGDQDNAAGLIVARPEENMLALKSAPADERRFGVGQSVMNSGAAPVDHFPRTIHQPAGQQPGPQFATDSVPAQLVCRRADRKSHPSY